jgi:hypothetical protein
MFWFKPFRNFLRKITIFRNFDQWSEILSMSDGRLDGRMGRVFAHHCVEVTSLGLQNSGVKPLSVLSPPFCEL